MQEWESGFIQFWDDAIKGSSALQAALRRRLADEVAVGLNRHVGAIYWDLTNFYDTVKTEKLATLGTEAGYNPRLLYVDMLFHMAVRVLRWQGKVSNVIGP